MLHSEHKSRSKASVQSKKSGLSRYQQAVNAIDVLTLRERARLMTKLQQLSIKSGRVRILKEAKQAREESARGEGVVGSADDIIRVLGTHDEVY